MRVSSSMQSSAFGKAVQQAETRPSDQAAKQADLRKHIADIECQSLRFGSHKMRSWMEDNEEWFWLRAWIARVIFQQRFEGLMSVVIILNLGLIIYSTDLEAKCFPNYASGSTPNADCPYLAKNVGWLMVADFLLLVIYTIEAIAHLYVERYMFFCSQWNVIDLVVVCTGWIGEILGGVVNINFLRIFRLARLSRAFRLVLSVRELYMLITGFSSAGRAIFFGCLMLLGMLVLWSIVLVDLVHPINADITYSGCDRCDQGYASVSKSTLTLFQQIVAGDAWGTISVPVIEKAPITVIIMAAIHISISLGVMNLILAVIVESATEARESDIEHRAKVKFKEQVAMKNELVKLCTSIDKDTDCAISLQEMEEAWEESPVFRNTLGIMQVHKRDLETIFELLDEDKSGQLDYREFVDKIYDLRTVDKRLYLAKLRHGLKTEIKGVHDDVIDKTQAIDMKVSAVQKQTMEHTSILENHTNLLESIHSKLSLLYDHNMSNGVAPVVKSSNQTCQTMMDSEKQGTIVSSATLQPATVSLSQKLGVACDDKLMEPPQASLDIESIRLCCSRSPSVDAEVVGELEGAQRCVEELVQLNQDISSRAGRHSNALQRHGVALQHMKSQLASCEAAKSQQLRRQLSQLRSHCNERLQVLFEGIDKSVEAETRALAMSNSMVDELAKTLSESGGVGRTLTAT